jgi:opacity protein-like surface antigen
MRSFLALGLLIILCASASAAAMHHSRRVIVRPSQGYAVLGSAYAAARPTHYDDTPSYDDPSKFGGDAALPVR